MGEVAMFCLRKVIVTGLTMLLMALAWPAFAQPQKIFSLQISATGTLQYQALFKNETPNGNSTINSVILTAPAGTVIIGAVPQNGAPTITGLNTNTINVANMPGIKAGGNTWFLTITLSAASPPCIAWNARAFTGNAFGGTEFGLLPPPASILTIN